ncbi:MAG: hypothetical protein A2069_06775 [Planctomycetes bacterium GWB2_41_19]|nr:MAG: hypothetical protein A2069_06775 [Planctomycetes bacterium GWB2_41_19]
MTEKGLVFPLIIIFFTQLFNHAMILFIQIVQNFFVMRITIKNTASKCSKLPDTAFIVLQKRTNIVRNVKVRHLYVLRNIVDLNTTGIEDMTKRTEITTRSARVTTGV